MKAEQYGNPAEQRRWKANWRNAGKGETRCDGCEFSSLTPSGNGGSARVHCTLLGVASKPNATCDRPGDLAGIQHCRNQSRWRRAKPTDPKCHNCEHFGEDADGLQTCFFMDFKTRPDDVCDHHELDEARRWQNAVATEDTAAPAVLDEEGADLERALAMPYDESVKAAIAVELTKRNPTIMAAPTDTQNLPAPTSTLFDVDKNFGDGEPYDYARLINETKFYLNQSADSIIEAGKRLILIKHHEGHGGFLPALEKIGIDARVAQQLIKVATKFGGSNTNTYSHLNVGKAKLLELTILDDEEIEDLEAGGMVRGLKQDEIERMSVRELRAALRQEKADRDKERKKLEQGLDAKQKIIDEKNKLLDARLAVADREEKIQACQAELCRETTQITAAIGAGLVSRLVTLQEACGTELADLLKLSAAQELGKILFAARTVAKEWDVVPHEQPTFAFKQAADDPYQEVWEKTLADMQGGEGHV